MPNETISTPDAKVVVPMDSFKILAEKVTAIQLNALAIAGGIATAEAKGGVITVTVSNVEDALRILLGDPKKLLELTGLAAQESSNAGE